MVGPKILKDCLYQLIRESKVEEFNELRKNEENISFVNGNFRGVDLRHFNLKGIDFSNSYFRQADLRGQDLSDCSFEGASIHGARISGVMFPKELSAEEINLSLQHGTRMRYK